MTLGIVGSHRSGKTTLAKAYAEKWNIPFVETKVSDIFKELGVDPSTLNNINKRIGIQFEILKRTCKLYEDANILGGFISDRTPLDMLAYTLADVGNCLLPIETERLVAQYTTECIQATNRYFSTLLLVQPGIPIVEAQGKAAASPAFMEHINSLLLGLMVDERVQSNHYYIPRNITDPLQRILALECAVGKSLGGEILAYEASDALTH